MNDSGENHRGMAASVRFREEHGSLLAFSLVEIVVAIGIVAVLAILAMPLHNMATAQAGGVKCASNLRQIGAGFMRYAADFGELPYYVDSTTYWYEGTDDPRSYFGGPYVGAIARDPGGEASASPVGGIFDCPTLKSEEARWAGLDYAYNITLTGRRISSFPQLSRTVLATEGGDYTRVKAQYSSSRKYSPAGASNPGGTAWNGPNLPIRYPHHGKANFLFLDGHVGLFRQGDLTEQWFDGNWKD